MIFAACALFAGGIFVYVFSPSTQLAHGSQKTRITYLEERKEVVYENLRDLNFEYKAGKFPEADYLKMRDSLEDEAATVLAELDKLRSL